MVKNAAAESDEEEISDSSVRDFVSTKVVFCMLSAVTIIIEDRP